MAMETNARRFRSTRRSFDTSDSIPTVTPACHGVSTLYHQRVILCQNYKTIANDIFPYSKTLTNFCIVGVASVSYRHGIHQILSKDPSYAVRFGGQLSQNKKYLVRQHS